MQLTTEVPTYFGPSDSPLFGVLHLPADHQIRGGVLICGSLGKEGTDSVRLHRILAEDLAGRGFAVLHFHYLGLGDSAFAQVRDDAVANWLASIGHALDYLTQIGAPSVTAIGVRAGCLLLDAYLTQSHAHRRDVDSVVYLDPAGTGRRYLREHTSLFRLSVGEDAATPGEVSVIGGRFSDESAAEFAALRMGADPVGAYGVDKVLLVGRPAETDKRLTALESAEGVESIVVDGLPKCAHTMQIPLPIPFPAVDSITEWIDHKAPTRTYQAAPQYLTTVTMPAQGSGGADVVESIERIEPKGLFVIRTRPQGSHHTPAKTVLFFVAAHDSHVGPSREWVELSRRIAVTGSQAVRWDPLDEGLSGEVRRRPWRRVYTRAEVTDTLAVARHACRNTGELELVGACSGSWYAAQGARHLGARSAILVNMVAWNWRVAPTLLQQWSFWRQTLQLIAAGDSGGGQSGSTTTGLKARFDRARASAMNVVHNHFPRCVLRVLSWFGLVWLPEDVLTRLARRGTAVTIIAAPEDVQHFSAKGGQAALGRLQQTSHPPRMIAIPTGDHAANHPAVLAAIRDAVLPATSVLDVTPPLNLVAVNGNRVHRGVDA